MKIKKRTLKSWDKAEIAHLKKSMKRAKKRGVNTDFEHANYLMVTFIAVLAGIISAAVFSTAGIIIPTFWLALFAAIVGLGIGNTFSAALDELDHLKKEHHLVYSSIIIITSIMSFVLVAKLPFFFQLSAKFGVEQNPAIIGGSYVIFFLLPYYLRLMGEKHERLDHPLR